MFDTVRTRISACGIAGTCGNLYCQHHTDDPGDGSTTGASAIVTNSTTSGTLRDRHPRGEPYDGLDLRPDLVGMAIMFDVAFFAGGSNISLGWVPR
jgi:hypothetical protein